MFRIPGRLHNEKNGILDTLKLLLGGTEMEPFLEDCRFYAKQIDRLLYTAT